MGAHIVCVEAKNGAVVGLNGVCQWSGSHHFDEELDLDLDLDPDQSEKSDPDPHQGDEDPHHSMEDLYGYLASRRIFPAGFSSVNTCTVNL